MDVYIQRFLLEIFVEHNLGVSERGEILKLSLSSQGDSLFNPTCIFYFIYQ